MKKTLVCLAFAAAVGIPSVASANGVALEANIARAHSDWGGEVGAGYNMTSGGFTLRPIVGVFFHEKHDDDKVRPYGKLEGTYTFPGALELGVGARLASDRLRAYGTLAYPLLPAISAKASAGDGYFAFGLKANF